MNDKKKTHEYFETKWTRMKQKKKIAKWQRVSEMIECLFPISDINSDRVLWYGNDSETQK